MRLCVWHPISEIFSVCPTETKPSPKPPHHPTAVVNLASDWRVLTLTLIRTAGGVYDFQNFEEIYLCNGLSSDLQNSCIPQKSLVSISC
jgi:hypothetical protein